MSRNFTPLDKKILSHVSSSDSHKPRMNTVLFSVVTLTSIVFLSVMVVLVQQRTHAESQAQLNQFEQSGASQNASQTVTPQVVSTDSATQTQLSPSPVASSSATLEKNPSSIAAPPAAPTTIRTVPIVSNSPTPKL
jgi:hypothetical protein